MNDGISEHVKLEILKKRIGRCAETLIAFRKYLEASRAPAFRNFSDMRHKESIISEIKECVHLVAEYNKLDVLPKVFACGFDTNIENMEDTEVASYIRNILRELQTAQDYLYAYLRPNLSEIEKGKIDLLRKDLDNLNTEEKIKKNLEIALMEAEFGHELACGIIASRVIVERLEKINGDNDEERLGNLVNLKIIDNNESSKFSSKAFLDAARAGRNAVSHKNSWFPNGAESLSLLSYAFRMSEWVSKYENTHNGTTNTNQ